MLKLDYATGIKTGLQNAASPIGEGKQDLHNSIFSRLVIIFAVIKRNSACHDLYRGVKEMSYFDGRLFLEKIKRHVYKTHTENTYNGVSVVIVILYSKPRFNVIEEILSNFDHQTFWMTKSLEWSIILNVFGREYSMYQAYELIQHIEQCSIVRSKEAAFITCDNGTMVVEDYPLVDEKQLTIAEAFDRHREKFSKGGDCCFSCYMPSEFFNWETCYQWGIGKFDSDYQVLCKDEETKQTVIYKCPITDDVNIFVNRLWREKKIVC